MLTAKNKQKLIIGIIIAVVFVVVMYFVIGAMEASDNSASYEEEEEFESPEILLGDEYYTQLYPVKSYLIMGTDGSGNEEAFGADYQGSMADFLLLVVIDEHKKQYGFLQLNRDTICNVPMLDENNKMYGGREMQLCTAHWYGTDKKKSALNQVEAVEMLLGGIEIDGYYAISMDYIGEINHVVDGVEVLIEDDYSNMDASLVQGETVTLTDEQAVSFVRGRMGVGDGENTSRMRRQRAYMNAFFKKVMEKNQSDSKFVIKAYDQLSNYATADINMKVVSNLSSQLGEYTSLGLLSPEGKTGVGQALDDGIDHTEFYMDETSLTEIVKQLYPLELVPEDEEDYEEDEDYDE